MRWVFDLPTPPSANTYWRVGKGRVYRSGEATQYKAAVAATLLKARIRCLRRQNLLRVEVDWTRNIRSGDLDNRLKIALDAMNGVLWEDDSQIVQIIAERFDGDTPGYRVRITVVGHTDNPGRLPIPGGRIDP